MSEYNNLITSLRKKAGPLVLEEILRLQELQTLPEDALGPGSVEMSVPEAILWQVEIAGTNGMTLAELHHRSLIVMPAGTLSVPAAVSLPTGWWCAVLATGAVTIDGGGTPVEIEANDLVMVMVAGGGTYVTPAVPLIGLD